MPTDEELVAEGMSIFRIIVSRMARRLCTHKIARDRFCPSPVAAGKMMSCDRHEREAEADYQRLVANGWEDA